MEQEIRETLETHHATRSSVIERIRQRWSTLPHTTLEDIEHWRTVGRPDRGHSPSDRLPHSDNS